MAELVQNTMYFLLGEDGGSVGGGVTVLKPNLFAMLWKYIYVYSSVM